MISDKQYINWQAKITGNLVYRRFWVFLGIYLILFYFVAGGYFAIVNRNWKIVVITAVAVLFTRYVVCELIHALNKKQHPYQRLDFIPPRSGLFSLTDQKPDAFPSEHASCASAVSVIFFAFYPALGAAGFAVALIIGVARIIIGYHEFSDVFWGWLAGLLSALLVLYLGHRIW